MNALVSKIDISSVVATKLMFRLPIWSRPIWISCAGGRAETPPFRRSRYDLVSKLDRGFDRDSMDGLTLLLRERFDRSTAGAQISRVRLRSSRATASRRRADGFDELASANARLILDAPVISIAWARTYLNGADLDFALSCSMIVADRDARFCFEADLASAVGIYGALAQKLGFVKAERLMENGEVLTAEQMQELGLGQAYRRKRRRSRRTRRAMCASAAARHNASYSMFRAQRITAPPVRRQSPAATASRRV